MLQGLMGELGAVQPRQEIDRREPEAEPVPGEFEKSLRQVIKEQDGGARGETGSPGGDSAGSADQSGSVNPEGVDSEEAVDNVIPYTIMSFLFEPVVPGLSAGTDESGFSAGIENVEAAITALNPGNAAAEAGEAIPNMPLEENIKEQAAVENSAVDSGEFSELVAIAEKESESSTGGHVIPKENIDKIPAPNKTDKREKISIPAGNDSGPANFEIPEKIKNNLINTGQKVTVPANERKDTAPQPIDNGAEKAVSEMKPGEKEVNLPVDTAGMNIEHDSTKSDSGTAGQGQYGGTNGGEKNGDGIIKKAEISKSKSGFADSIAVASKESHTPGAAANAKSATAVQEAVDRFGGPESVKESVFERVLGHMEQMRGEGEHTARIRLHPPELGELMLEVSVEKNSLKLAMKSDIPETAKILESGKSELIHKFREMGFDTREITVNISDFGSSSGRHSSQNPDYHNNFTAQEEEIITEPETPKQYSGGRLSMVA